MSDVILRGELCCNSFAALITKLHPSDEKKHEMGLHEDVISIGNDPQIYETCIVGLNESERMQFYQEIVKESVSQDLNSNESTGSRSLLNSLCYSALQLLVRGISIDISATSNNLLHKENADLSPLITILSALAYVVSGLWIPPEGHVICSPQGGHGMDQRMTEEIEHMNAVLMNEKEKSKGIYQSNATKWTILLLTDCIIDHDDLLVTLLGLLDSDIPRDSIQQHEDNNCNSSKHIIPLLVFYIFAKQNIHSWLEPFHDLFLQKALYSLSTYQPPLAIVHDFPPKVSRTFPSNSVKLIWETHVYSSIAKLFELNNVSQEVSDLGFQEFLRDLVEKIIQMVQGNGLVEENEETVILSELRDAMIQVVYSTSKSHLWLALDYVLKDISKIAKRLSDVISEKPSTLQIQEVAAVWNMVIWVLSLLSTSKNTDKNLMKLTTDHTASSKSSQQYLSEFEKRKKLMIMNASSSVEPLQAILSHDTSVRGEIADFTATNKIKFFELITPKQGVGMLALPLQNLLRHSRLAASLCYSNLISVLRKFEMWHVPSGGLKLVLRCLNHLLLNVPAGLMAEQANTTLATQRSEYLKSFVISCNALFQLLENVNSECWKDMKGISVPVGQVAKSYAIPVSNSVNLSVLHDRLLETCFGLSHTLSKVPRGRRECENVFELVLMFERLYAVARVWRSLSSLDAIQKGLLAANQYQPAQCQSMQYRNHSQNRSFCRVLNSGNLVLNLSSTGLFPEIVHQLYHITSSTYFDNISSSGLSLQLTHAFDQGLFSFKHIFHKANTPAASSYHHSSHYDQLPQDTSTASEINKLKALSNCFALCCDFIYQSSVIAAGNGEAGGEGFCDFNQDYALTMKVIFILNSLRITWQYYIFSLALALFSHLTNNKIGEVNHHEDKFNTPMNTYMTTQLEYGHSLRSMFPSPLRTFAYPVSSQMKYASQDNRSEDHQSAIEQLIICSSFPPAMEVTQDLLQLLHHVMEHLSLSLLRLSSGSVLFKEILQTQSLILESIWWFLHRITGFSAELIMSAPLEFVETGIQAVLKPTNTPALESLFHRLKSLANHLGIFLPITKSSGVAESDNDEEAQHAGEYLMLLTMLHFHFYDQCQDNRKGLNLLLVAVSCCINGLTESAMLPSICSLLPAVVANYSNKSIYFQANGESGHGMVFIAYFLKLVYGKLSQMTSPSPSEQLEEELMITMADGLRVMMSVPLLLVSVNKQHLQRHNISPPATSSGQQNQSSMLEDVLYNCLRSCWSNMEVMLTLWVDLEQICESYQYQHHRSSIHQPGSSSLMGETVSPYTNYDLLGVDQQPIVVVYDDATSLDTSSLPAFASRAAVIGLFAKKLSDIYRSKVLSRSTVTVQTRTKPSLSSFPVTSGICEIWLKQLVRQSLGLTVRLLLQFVTIAESINHDDANNGKSFLGDFICVLKTLTAFSPSVLTAMSWLPSLSIEVILSSQHTGHQANPNTNIEFSCNVMEILSTFQWLNLFLTEHLPQQQSTILTASNDDCNFKEWYCQLSGQQHSGNGLSFWETLMDQLSHEGIGIFWRESIVRATSVKAISGLVENGPALTEDHPTVEPMQVEEEQIEQSLTTSPIPVTIAQAEQNVTPTMDSIVASSDQCIVSNGASRKRKHENVVYSETQNVGADGISVSEATQEDNKSKPMEADCPQVQSSSPVVLCPSTPQKIQPEYSVEKLLGGSATQTPAPMHSHIVADEVSKLSHISSPNVTDIPDYEHAPCSTSSKRIRQGFAPITYTSLDRDNLLEYTQEASQELSQPLLMLKGLAPKLTSSAPIPTTATKAPNANSNEAISEIMMNKIGDAVRNDIPHLSTNNTVVAADATVEKTSIVAVSEKNSNLKEGLTKLQQCIADYQHNKDKSNLWQALQECQNISNLVIQLLKPE